MLEWIVWCQEGHGVGVDSVRVMVLEWIVWCQEGHGVGVDGVVSGGSWCWSG